MRLFSSAQSRPLTSGHHGNTPDTDDGGDAVQVPATHQPPPWLGWLLFVSLLVMLNTHLFITLAAGIDQYSLYTADSSVSQPYPAALAQSPYPALLTLAFNVLLSLLAYVVYRLIWRYFTSPRATSSEGPERNPFQQNAVALAIPVFIAMAPSLALCYTNLKPYFVIVGALIAIVLCIVGALKDPAVNLDSSTRGYWFNVSVAAIFVMMTLAVVVTLYFQFIPAEPPTGNLLWSLGWNLYPLEEFEPRARGGMLLFGLVSLAYMVAVLGGVLLATLHPPRIGQQAPAPDSEPDPLPRASGAIYSVSASTPEGLAREILRAQVWATETLARLKEEAPRVAQEPAYLAVLSGIEEPISSSEYERLVDESGGFLSEVDLLVDRVSGTVKNRDKAGLLKRVNLQPTPNNYTYHTLCLYSSRPPGRPFTTLDIEKYLREETGDSPSNINHITSSLRKRGFPLKSNKRVTYLIEGTKACFLDRLPPTS